MQAKSIISIIVILCCTFFYCASPQAPDLKRYVIGQDLFSDTLPEMTIRFEKEFKSIGSNTFILGNNSKTEQFFFVKAGKDRKIQAVYTVQFESYLPDNSNQYNYDLPDSVFIDGKYFLTSPVFNKPNEVLQEDSLSDVAHRWRFLRNNGYTIPGEAIGHRFIRLVDDSKRNEVLIIFNEDLGLYKTNEVQLDQNKALLDSTLTNIFNKAISGFSILKQ